MAKKSIKNMLLWLLLILALIIAGILIVVGVDPTLVMIGLITYWIVTSVIVYLME